MKNRIDEKLSAALYDVPLPDGLAERILQRLDANPCETLELASADASPAPHGIRQPDHSRRRLLMAAGLAAAALLAIVWLGLSKGEALPPQFVLDEAIRAFLSEPQLRGRLLDAGSAPADYPFSQTVSQVRGTRWRLLPAFVDRPGVVYELPGPAGTSAALFVVAAPATADFDAAPAVYPFTTAGCCASAWQEDGLLYVLVVQGDPVTYRAYLHLPNSPMA
jgi:hypothetical protein